VIPCHARLTHDAASGPGRSGRSPSLCFHERPVTAPVDDHYVPAEDIAEIRRGTVALKPGVPIP